MPFSLFLYNWLIFPAMIAQTFKPTAELAIPRGTLTNEASSEIETQPLTAEIKHENVRSNSKPCTLFWAFHWLNHHVLFHLKDDFLFHLFF